MTVQGRAGQGMAGQDSAGQDRAEQGRYFISSTPSVTQ